MDIERALQWAEWKPEEAGERANQASWSGCCEQEYRWMHKTITEDLPCQKGVIVEIGSWLGSSTIILAAAAQEIAARVYSIDTFHLGALRNQEHIGLDEGTDRFWLYRMNRTRLLKAGLAPFVNNIIGDSLTVGQDVAFNGVLFLWIDGYHRYPQALREWELYVHNVVSGGVIGIHDAQEVGGAKDCIAEIEQKPEFNRFFSEWDCPPLGPQEINPSVVHNDLRWLTRAWRRETLPLDMRDDPGAIVD